MKNNQVTATFGITHETTTRKLYQIDQGIMLQFRGIELPVNFEVHFSNDKLGQAKTQIGSHNEVEIPAEYLATGKDVYAWVYLHEGENDGETVYVVTIPVERRATLTDAPPTPAEQTAISEAIIALNEAIEHAPKIEDNHWFIWDAEAGDYVDTGVQAEGDKGDKGDPGYSPIANVSKTDDTSTITITDQSGTTTAEVNDGYSPSATVSKSGDTSTITITDKTGTTTAQVKDGEKGDTGQPGADGYSPSASVSKAGKVTTITVTDKTGTTTATVNDGQDGAPGQDGVDGQDGQDGISPTASVSKSGTTTTLTVTDAQGTTTAQIEDGTTPVKGTDYWTASDKAEIVDDVMDEVSPSLDALRIYDTASGAIASFPDGADNVAVKSLVCDIDPVQDLHGYDNPWPPGGGVNKLDPSHYTGASYPEVIATGVQFSMEGGDTFVVTVTNYSGTSEQPALIAFLSDLANFDKTGLTLARFVVSDPSSIIRNIRWASAANNNNLAFDLKNCTTGQTATAKVKLVLYEGSTAPTTFSPYSNLCPISGWTGMDIERDGKNMFNKSIFEQWSNWTYPITTDGFKADTYNRGCFLPQLPTGAYTISFDWTTTFPDYLYLGKVDSSGYGTRVAYLTTESITNATYTFEVSEGERYFLRMQTIDESAFETQMAKFGNCMLEPGSTAHSYTPYSGQTIPISWQTEAGTVYGGTLDVVTGVLTAETELITLTGEESGWTKHGTRTVYTTSIARGTLPAVGSDFKGFSNYISTGSNGIMSSTYLTHVNNGTGTEFRNVQTNWGVADNEVNTWKAFLASLYAANKPIQILVYLQTPTTYQLTPHEVKTLLGDNNIWADTGDSAVEYGADTKLYIDKKLSS